MREKFIHMTLAAIVLAMNCHLVIANQTKKQPMQTAQQPEFKNAQDYIEFFRKGGEYYDTYRLPGLMIGTQPDPAALKVLGEALLEENRDVRKSIVRLLGDVAHLNHPAYELRTPEIIALLVGPGFAKLDSGRNDAMDLLRQRASTTTLSRYEDIFLRALKEDWGGSILPLIAKAKPKGAWEEVDRLSQLPELKDESVVRITRAALGDTKIENEYIADAKKKEDAGDVFGLSKSLHPLVQIGTQRSLQAVCLRMRSPLVMDSPGIDRRSFRLSVMDALVYAFPEEAEILNSNSVMKDEDYIRAEQFCVKATGVQYDKPRPEFFTSFGYPRM